MERMGERVAAIEAASIAQTMEIAALRDALGASTRDSDESHYVAPHPHMCIECHATVYGEGCQLARPACDGRTCCVRCLKRLEREASTRAPGC